MGHLLGCLKKEKERTAAFQALGLLVVAVRTEIQPYLTKILEIIKAALPPKDFAHKSVKTIFTELFFDTFMLVYRACQVSKV